MPQILRKCGHGYTLRAACKKCGKTRTPHPPPYRERFMKYVPKLPPDK